MSSERLIYLPLGGAGEVGMNCYVYGWGKPGAERLIVLDLGVTFPDMETSPGVDLIMPDVDWLEACRDRIEAIFITHAHEDHVGAVGHLWPRLKAPVYARRFTAHIARMKMEEQGLSPEVIQTVEAWPARVDAGPFKVGFAPISHSIPESSMMVLDTPAGRVVHTADFKVDRTPLVGEPFDEALYREIAGAGVQALVCDSTNAFVQNPGRSEAVLGPEIQALVKSVRGMVVATTFASNIARVKTLAEAGRAAGRSVCLLGRAMKRMIGAATETGVLTGFPPTIEVEDAANIPRDNLMLIVTGSQGERRAASAQLSRGKYLGMEMKEGDLFLFSSRTIPGNEKGVIRIMNSFSELGVDVMDDRGGKYHVSGHANRPDLELMHEIMKPKILIPMHGEHMHLREHVRIGAAKGIPGAIAVNGTMLDITGAVPTITAYEEAGRTYLDGGVLIGALDGVVRDRIRMALNGHVTVTVIVDEDDETLGDPWCDTMGLPEKGKSKAALVEVLEEDLSQFLGRADRKTIRDEERLDEALRRIVRNTAQNEVGKKPEVTVVVSRLG
jgi:ribonuclease J